MEESKLFFRVFWCFGSRCGVLRVGKTLSSLLCITIWISRIRLLCRLWWCWGYVEWVRLSRGIKNV